MRCWRSRWKFPARIQAQLRRITLCAKKTWMAVDAMEISEQNEVLTEHLHFLQETLQKMARIQPCDSFAMPPPSALRTPASAVPTAAGVKRGLEGEHADSPRPCARPAPGPPARALTAGGSPFVWPPQPLSDGQPAGGREAASPLLSLGSVWPAGCWPTPRSRWRVYSGYNYILTDSRPTCH